MYELEESFCGPFKRNWRDLKGIPLGIWLVFVIHALDSFADFQLDINLTLFYRTEYGQTDTEVASIYAYFGGAMVLFGVPCGYAIDYFDLKFSMIIGAILLTASRFIFALTEYEPLGTAMLLIGMPLGSGLLITSLHVAVDRMPETPSKNIAFSLLYGAMNVGALFASLVSDGIATTTFANLSGYRAGFVVGAICTSLNLALSWISPLPPAPQQYTPVVASDSLDCYSSDEDDREQGFFERHIFSTRVWKLATERQLWKVILFSSALVPVKTLFKHFSTILPIYLIRTIGPNVRYGSVLSVNPILIVFFSLILGNLSRRVKKIYAAIVLGTVISALSPLIAGFLPSESNVISMIAFLLVFTIGEALYSPKATQYQLALSPPGRKAIYSGLIALPGFAGTILSGEMSGWLLVTFCPEGDVVEDLHTCSAIWLVVSAVALLTPIALVAVSGLFRVTQHSNNLEQYSAQQQGWGDLQLKETRKQPEEKTTRRAATIGSFYSSSED